MAFPYAFFPGEIKGVSAVVPVHDIKFMASGGDPLAGQIYEGVLSMAKICGEMRWDFSLF